MTSPSLDTTPVFERKALCQIRERDYIHGLNGRTLLYGIAFRNKKATVVSEEVQLIQ